MSGGAFDYQQYYIEEIADSIKQEIIEAGREIPQEIWAKSHWYGNTFDDSDRTYPTYGRYSLQASNTITQQIGVSTLCFLND